MGLNSVDPRGSINISNPIGYSKYFYNFHVIKYGTAILNS